jgi:hypothetical protein
VEDAPFDVRERHAEEGLPPARAEHARGLFLVRPGGFHHGDDLAGDERKRDEHRREHDPGHGKNDAEVVFGEPRTKEALASGEQHEDQTGDDRRHRDGQIDQRDQHVPTAKPELGNRPSCAEAEDQVGRNGHRRGDERQPEGSAGVRLHDGGEVRSDSGPKGPGEHGKQRDREKEREESDRDAGERPSDNRRLGQGPGRPRGRSRRRMPCDPGGRDHRATLRVLQACSMLISRSSPNDTSSMTSATAVAPA